MAQNMASDRTWPNWQSNSCRGLRAPPRSTAGTTAKDLQTSCIDRSLEHGSRGVTVAPAGSRWTSRHLREAITLCCRWHSRCVIHFADAEAPLQHPMLWMVVLEWSSQMEEADTPERSNQWCCRSHRGCHCSRPRAPAAAPHTWCCL